MEHSGQTAFDDGRRRLVSDHVIEGGVELLLLLHGQLLLLQPRVVAEESSEVDGLVQVQHLVLL